MRGIILRFIPSALLGIAVRTPSRFVVNLNTSYLVGWVYGGSLADQYGHLLTPVVSMPGAALLLLSK